MNSWFKDNDIEIYLSHNEGKSVVAERFTGALKTKIYKHITVISKNVYIDKLDDIVNKYNNTYHSTIKIKPVDLGSSTDISFNEKCNDKDPKFKVVDHVSISKLKKNIFAREFTPNCSGEVFVIKKVKNILSWT